MNMKKRFVTGLFILCGPAAGLMAQRSIVNSLEAPTEGQGTVTLHQDARLTGWLEKGSVPGESAYRPSTSKGTSQGTGVSHSSDSISSRRTPGEPVKKSGYRLQVYSGPATRDAKNKAANAVTKARIYFPDIAAYSIFVSPRWVCVVGDFPTLEEARAMKERIIQAGAFNEATIVRSQIIVTQ